MLNEKSVLPLITLLVLLVLSACGAQTGMEKQTEAQTLDTGEPVFGYVSFSSLEEYQALAH